ncbi:hypothetical protein Purlil1_1200 [Purpureocillium lilacinum]|uniref:Uncharacterized protein n=1 Tax=Purpureocillium lilacinum TaxID=33203 RepID=A0ABR0CEP2_PURLI|nr:hypothetical protein Purlil1_1200 [Purpureocillium lilacinum]
MTDFIAAQPPHHPPTQSSSCGSLPACLPARQPAAQFPISLSPPPVTTRRLASRLASQNPRRASRPPQNHPSSSPSANRQFFLFARHQRPASSPVSNRAPRRSAARNIGRPSRRPRTLWNEASPPPPRSISSTIKPRILLLALRPALRHSIPPLPACFTTTDTTARLGSARLHLELGSLAPCTGTHAPHAGYAFCRISFAAWPSTVCCALDSNSGRTLFQPRDLSSLRPDFPEQKSSREGAAPVARHVDHTAAQKLYPSWYVVSPGACLPDGSPAHLPGPLASDLILASEPPMTA